jgi:hypothetical protein
MEAGLRVDTGETDALEGVPSGAKALPSAGRVAGLTATVCTIRNRIRTRRA